MEPSIKPFLVHLELYLSRRDGIDKLLKLLRYSSLLLLSSRLPLPPSLPPRLHSFQSSLSLSRKAFRLLKFIQNINALRPLPHPPLAILAHAAEALYYFLEQFIWLSKTGLISLTHIKRIQKLSAWAELVSYVANIVLKLQDIKKLRSEIRDGGKEEEERGRLRGKVAVKGLSVVQDVADGVMALADVREGKGVGTDPLLLASAGMVSAVISARKNWAAAC